MFGGEDVAEVVTVGVDEEDFQGGCEERHPDALRQQSDMEEQDHDDDGAEDSQGNAHVAADQQEDSGDDVEEADEVEPSVSEHKAHHGSGVAGGRCHGEEVQEYVEAEDGEHEAQEETGDEGSDLHGQTLLDEKK